MDSWMIQARIGIDYAGRLLGGALAVICLVSLFPSLSAADGFYALREDVDALEFVDLALQTTTSIVTIDQNLGSSTIEVHSGMALLPNERQLLVVSKVFATTEYKFLTIDICTGGTALLADASPGETGKLCQVEPSVENGGRYELV